MQRDAPDFGARLIGLPLGLGVGQKQIRVAPCCFRDFYRPALLFFQQLERLADGLVGGEVEPLERRHSIHGAKFGSGQHALGQGHLRLGVALGRRLAIPKLGASPFFVSPKLLLCSCGQTVSDNFVGIKK